MKALFWTLDRLFPREVIGLRNEDPYLIRWVLRRGADGSGIYLHLFIGDDAADPHDHPKDFVSIGLWGSYDEEVFVPDHKWVHHRAPWFRKFGPTHVHRIVLCGAFVWTLVKVGPTLKDWGFYTPEGWIEWTKYKPDHHDLNRR